MKKITLILLTLISANIFAQQLNTLSPQEKKQGFKLLFDGKTMNGWRSYNKTTPAPAWQVSDNAIMLDDTYKDGWMAKGGGEITTDGVYENFEFMCEWKISPGGNSGIIFDAQEDPKYDYSWRTGPEFQVLDNEGHDDGKIPKHRAGNLYDVIKYEPENVKPVGEWNQAKIVQKNGLVKLYLNGKNVITYQIGSEEYNKMVADSKFKRDAKDYDPNWGSYTKGHIVLQDHGARVWYRNLKIRKL
jgi:hypothetical protein